MARDRLVADDATMALTLDTRHGSSILDPVWAERGDAGSAPAVVCVLDETSARHRTTPFAVELARRLGWRVALVPLPSETSAADQRRLIVAAALDKRGQLLVIPASAPTAADPAGTAASLALARIAPCPTIAVPVGGRRPPGLDGPVVCGIADCDTPAPAARTAARLALSLGARLKLVHVASPAEGASERPADANAAFRGILWQALHKLDVTPPVDLVLERGEPAGRLSTAADQAGAALLVIGTPMNRERWDNDRQSVATAVLGKSGVPVMLVQSGTVETVGPPTAACGAAAA